LDGTCKLFEESAACPAALISDTGRTSVAAARVVMAERFKKILEKKE
jgi:hypothetical protein